MQKQARTIGPEAVCRSTLSMLKVREFLNSRGWSREQVDLALMQIIARAIYPYSELKTVRCLQGNSALLEMFKLERRKVTKDALYQSAERLWEVHREMEDFLHERVTNIFHLEEKILLLDITNTYFEGRMEDSKICFHGRSKEKRDDCKIMVMDAGFYSDANAKWLVENHFDYITVLPSGYAKFTADSDRVVRHEDCRHQEIRLQMGKADIEGEQHKALLVDSDAKALT